LKASPAKKKTNPNTVMKSALTSGCMSAKYIVPIAP